MRYAFGEYVLDTKQQLLFANEQRVELEPKQYSTLLLLCQHQNEIVTREQLLETSWSGVIVSENTINKHIAVLRKLLGDNAKSPKYIETVAKKGYRFIANPKLFDEAPSTVNIEHNNNTVSFKPNFLLLGLLVTVLILVSIYLFLWLSPSSTPAQDIKTLTRMQGDKWSISFFKNDQTTVFINQKPQNSELILQDLNSQKTQLIQHQFDFLSFVVGAISQPQLYIVGKQGGKNWLVKGNIVNNTFIVEQQLDISELAIYDIEFSSHLAQLYLIAQTTSIKDRGLYRVDQNLTDIVPLYLPKNDNVLLTRVDSGINKEAILLLGQRPNARSIVYAFTPKNKELNKVHEFDAYVRDAIWHNEFILHTDTPPAQRILKRSIEQNSSPTIVATSSEYLCCEMIFSQSLNQIIYRTNTTNYQIEWVGEPDFAVDNSTVYDMTPSLMHHKKGIAFVSKRSGKSQIYTQQKLSPPKQISNFTRYHIVHALSVSPNDNRLAAIVDNQLLLFATNAQSLPISKVFNNIDWLEDVTWLDDKHLIVRHKTKSATWLEIYDTELNSIKKLPSQWLQLFRSEYGEARWFALHTSHGLVELEPLMFNPDVELKIAKELNGSIQDTGKIINAGPYFYQQINKKQIQQLDSQGEYLKHHDFQRIYGFDAHNTKLIVSELTYRSSDWHTKSIAQ